MMIRRVFAVAALSTMVLVGAAVPAFAHAELKSSNPAKGATLAKAPTRVSLTFEEPVTLPDDPLSVTGPDGAKWTVGEATVSGATISAPVTASGPAGAYKLTYKVVSDDGDDVTGSVSFTVTAAGPATTTAVPTTSSTSATKPAPATTAETPTQAAAADSGSGGGVPAWVWIVVAVLALAGGVTIALRLGRSPRA